MKSFFQKKPTAKEAAKEAKRQARREVRQNQRDLDREMRELDRQEKQLIAELKQRAKVAGNKDSSLNVMAKQLVQIRNQKEKLLGTKSQLGAIGMHATTMASTVAAASAIGNVTDAMKNANATMDVAETTKIMMNFQKETEKLQVKEEMMDDVLTDAFEQDDIEEEAEQVTNQVLAELGIEMDQQFVGLNAPTQKMPQQQEALSTEEQQALEDVLPDLKARLNAL